MTSIDESITFTTVHRAFPLKNFKEGSTLMFSTKELGRIKRIEGDKVIFGCIYNNREIPYHIDFYAKFRTDGEDVMIYYPEIVTDGAHGLIDFGKVMSLAAYE